MLRLLYSLLLLLATPLIMLRLLWRGVRQPEYRRHWRERWGFPSAPPLSRSIWIHAVSVGEIRATVPLVQRLRASRPSLAILITCMTPTGRATAAELYADSVTCVYLPYDFRSLHRRLIARFRPVLLVIMETEIWPNLLAACSVDRLPALLVNARLSDRSWRGYRRLPPVRRLVHDALQSLHAVAAQTAEDGARLANLGAPAALVTGNVKFDLPLDDALIALGQGWRQAMPAAKRVLLAASTRDGEEAMLLQAYRQAFDAGERRSMLLVVVPRHPQRFADVDAMLRDSGLRHGRRSEGAPPADIEAWLGDSMGEMAAYIAMADLVFIGGSLLPLGGQNLIEACAQGRPVLMGPSTFNFAEAARLAVAAGAMQQADDAAAVMELARVLLHDDGVRDRMAASALVFARAHAGATEKTMGLIAPLIDRGDAR